MISASFSFLRRDQLEERYFALIGDEFREQVRCIEPMSWCPIALAVAHYRAMDVLYPNQEQQFANGRENAERTVNVYAKTVVRAAAATGHVDPTAILKRLTVATDRSFRGGGAIAAYRTGAKDARTEWVGVPTLGVPYARNAFQGMLEGTLVLAARRVFVRRDLSFAPACGGHVAVAYDISWV